MFFTVCFAVHFRISFHCVSNYFLLIYSVDDATLPPPPSIRECLRHSWKMAAPSFSVWKFMEYCLMETHVLWMIARHWEYLREIEAEKERMAGKRERGRQARREVSNKTIIKAPPTSTKVWKGEFASGAMDSSNALRAISCERATNGAWKERTLPPRKQPTKYES